LNVLDDYNRQALRIGIDTSLSALLRYPDIEQAH
jgi:hypothetical protein